MKTICLYFEIHQNIQLKRYRFFDIGTDHYYYDDYENARIISDVAERSYMPALTALLDMIKQNGKYFKVAFSLSGVGMEQLEMHAPQVIEMLQKLNETGCVEFLAEPYSHGLASLVNEDSFAAEVKRQCAKMKEYFGQEPKVLRNSSLIYSDDIGLQASQLGFKGMLTEGAKHVLGWKSPHYVYNCALAPNLKLLLRDVALSDDISLRFSNKEWPGYPLFADNYIDRIASLNEAIEGLNDYLKSRETPYVFGYFGDHQVAFDNQLPPKKGNFANPDYVTQFVVRTNRKTDFVQQQDFLDLAFVGGVLLDVAGLSPKDDFMRANIAMRQLSQGKLEDAEDVDLVNSYRNYLYQDLKIAQ